MENVILFGASRGGINFIKNNREKMSIIAIADNNNERWGQYVENVLIIDPNTISLYDCDKIIITSMFLKGITSQLLNLGVPSEKIEYASKNAMKLTRLPFSDPVILDKAEQLLFFLSELLKNERYYFTFGTCLGIVRDNGLIAWDDDMDIAIHHNDAEYILNLIKFNISTIDSIIENKVYLRKYPNNEITSISIDCYEKEELLFNINLDCLYEEGEYARFELDLIPLNYFLEPTIWTFKGRDIKLPSEYDSYLTHIYKEWRTVKKDTSFFNNTTTYVEPTVTIQSELIHEHKKV